MTSASIAGTPTGVRKFCREIRVGSALLADADAALPSHPKPEPRLMPMTQDDIRRHYETQWARQSGAAAAGQTASVASGSATPVAEAELAYSSPVEDAMLYPAYEQLLRDLRREPNGVRLLDVGAGSGRWLRFFLSRYAPAAYVGIDFALASVDLLRKWSAAHLPPHAADAPRIEFRHANIADPQLDLGEPFDLVNIANVLFHIPEPELFEQALHNLRRHLAPGGAIVTTEYMPRDNYRTEWMQVRSRYVFEDAIRRAGLRIAATRAFCFFSNDPMGLDGPDSAGRQHFNAVRAYMRRVMEMSASPDAKQFFTQFFVEIERAALAFARERVAEVDLPSQKLVVLTTA